MGGWIRDALLGAPVKDMDIYLSPTTGQNKEEIEAVAKEFYEARGHEYILFNSKKREGAEEGSPYNEYLLVYQSQNVPEGDFPVDLIFTPTGYEHPGDFDLGICEHMFWIPAFAPLEIHHHETRNALRDRENKTITVLQVEDGMFNQMNNWAQLTDEQFEKAYTRMLGHLDRLKEKYPDYTVVMDLNSRHFDQRAEKLYGRLKEDNYFGETGPVLPTEASITERDAVRQLDREDLVRIMRGEAERPTIQATNTLVQGGAPVPPGFFDFEGEDFINRILQQDRQIREGVASGRRTHVLTANNTVPITTPRANRNNGPRDAFGGLR